MYYALLLLALGPIVVAQDPVDLLAASGLDKTTAKTFQPANAILTDKAGYGTLQSSAFDLDIPLSSANPLKVTDTNAKNEIFAAIPSDAFGVSFLAIFNRFQGSFQGRDYTASNPNPYTIISIRDQSTIYFQIDFNVYADDDPLSFSGTDMDLLITWRSRGGQLKTTKFVDIDPDNKIDQPNDWSYLHFAFVRERPSSDLDSQRTRISFYHSCARAITQIADSTFIAKPPSTADIFVAGIVLNSADLTVSNQLLGIFQDFFFRFTPYSFVQISVDYCSVCVVDCTDYLGTIYTENRRLAVLSVAESGKLNDCLLKKRPPSPCVTGCRLEDGSRIDVGERKVVSKCRTCACIDNGKMRCFETCDSCTGSDGVIYTDGELMPPTADLCQTCPCSKGTRVCTDYPCGNDYCRRLGDGSVYSENGLSCTKAPSCANLDGVGCGGGAAAKGCFCPSGQVMHTDLKSGVRQCLKKSSCPCFANGKSYPGGSFIAGNGGKTCYCLQAKIQC
ncbi:uncharacterized protein [Oscarella lobularis]|uniref:uncharacterized protein n=1 Tax=Oscarella lobularis TaxID=121494 RepID=UPI0033134587